MSYCKFSLIRIEAKSGERADQIDRAGLITIAEAKPAP